MGRNREIWDEVFCQNKDSLRNESIQHEQKEPAEFRRFN